jgi:serine/threonine-protein kinase RsbT
VESPSEIRILVRAEMDATAVVLKTVEHAKQAGFDDVAGRMIATAASELARNILHHAEHGEVFLRILSERGRHGIEIEARDRGPGIPDIERAMSDHFSTAGTLGLGLPGVERLMDELEVQSTVGVGTCVTTRKFL